MATKNTSDKDTTKSATNETTAAATETAVKAASKKAAAKTQAAEAKPAAKKSTAAKKAAPKKVQAEPEPEKTRYTDEELEEFRQLINEKLAVAQSDYEKTMDRIMGRDTNEVDDTAPTYHALEEGSETQSKEQLMAMAQRQQKFITGLKAALVRIDNKTYGICRETGKLIPKERLRAVPHATLSIEVKNDKHRTH